MCSPPIILPALGRSVPRVPPGKVLPNGFDSASFHAEAEMVSDFYWECVARLVANRLRWRKWESCLRTVRTRTYESASGAHDHTTSGNREQYECR
jgi:hypothetical protein